ncbi:MAG: fatty acyl-AMP ligase [Nitrospirales bacterium]|nr:fatty acyl-AMP ligase [Nitrospira sp.]MDR4461395.1 fatty acyl-AMP ligase [Nitrospirales bacterium]
MNATPTHHQLRLKHGNFSTLSEALDYAALGETGCNFYSGRGKLTQVLTYTSLKRQAQSLARRLNGLELPRGARVALIADTTPDFIRFFFACQYAGLIPVPLPISLHLGGQQAYVTQLRRLLESCQASIAMAPEGFLPFLEEAATGLDLALIGGPETFASLEETQGPLTPLEPQELAYIQYTSGSTRWPRGVEVTQSAVMTNLSGIIQHGLQVQPGDRCVSWLPFYHDMGLVGFVLGPIASQLSVDYLSTRDFAMRPRQWLSLMTKSRATISFSPSFGYELCVRRLGEDFNEHYDLSSWRIAGAGAETIRADSLSRFAETLRSSGFRPEAFLACYGMAECSLAISFAPLNKGLEVDRIDGDHLSNNRLAMPFFQFSKDDEPARCSKFVNCGVPLPGYEVEIRNMSGDVVKERESGIIFVRGASTMTGYFNDPILTREVLSTDGWLNTGDIGYWVGNSLVIIGRSKDMIIINGRNIWPQDLEFMAEQQAEVRPGDASAFSVSTPDGHEIAIMVVQCREMDTQKREDLVQRLRSLVHKELSIPCYIELIPPRTLPRTSSGKLSRSRAKADFLTRIQWEEVTTNLFATASSA